MGFFDFLSENGNILEEKNLGKPQNPNIKLNPDESSEDIPQAWEYKNNWYYNFPGAIAEAEYLGKKIPTLDNWREIIKGLTIEQFSNMLQFDIHRCWYNGEIFYEGSGSYVWSSSNKDEKLDGLYDVIMSSGGGKKTQSAYGLFVKASDFYTPITNTKFQYNRGLSVRCLKN